MPYKFVYKIDNHEYFQCKLQCSRCTARTADGVRCNNTTCIGVPLCWVHLAKTKHLRIKPSTIPNAGKGLFATGDADTIIFRKGAVILDYHGERLTRAELDKRYGDYTATYAISDTYGREEIIEDAACIRGAAALANSKRYKRDCNAHFVISLDGTRIQMLATKNIRGGSEIFAHYGGEYLFEDNVSYATKPSR